MKIGLLHRAFGVYPSEERNLFRFARLTFFWAFGSSSFETLSDSLLLAYVGAEALPSIYLTIALLMLGVSTLILYSLRITSPVRIYLFAMGVGAAVMTLATILVAGSPPDLFWYLFKISSRMFFLVTLTTFWTFTNQYHDLQDAKRLYALYSATYFCGIIASGLAMDFLLDWIHYSGLFALAVLSTLWAMRETLKITRKSKTIHDDGAEGILAGTRDSIGSVARLILKSPYTLILLTVSLLIQLLWTVTEFNYMESFGKLFASSPNPDDELTKFLGGWRAGISSANIFADLFLFSRAVRRFGLSNIALLAPLFFLVVYVGWTTKDLLLFALLGFIAVEGVLFMFEDNCFNLLANTVPSKLKSRVRIINDSFFEPIGLLISSLLLIWASTSTLWLGLILSTAALMMSLILRSNYASAILSNLKDNALHFEKKLSHWISTLTRREQKEARQEIIRALQSGEGDLPLLSCEALLELKDTDSLPALLRVSHSFGTMEKIKLLRLFEESSFASDAEVLETIEKWAQNSESPELLRWVTLYLAKRGVALEEIDPDHPDLFYRCAAILAMKSSSPLNRTIAAKKLDLMLQSSHIDEVSMGLDILTSDRTSIEETNLPQSRSFRAECGIGSEKMKKRVPTVGESPSFEEGVIQKVLPFLWHDSLLVKRTAARCITRMVGRDSSRYASDLIEQLDTSRDNQVRLFCLDALGKIADSTTVKEILEASIQFRPSELRKAEEVVLQMGLKTVPILLSILKDPSMPEDSRILACKILSRLSLPQLQANLVEILDIEIERAYFYFYFSQTIQKQYPHHDLAILRSALFTGYQSVVDFITHLLGAARSLENPEFLTRALHSRNAKLHSLAVESLERTCPLRIFKMIAPLVDDLPIEEKMAACLSWYDALPKCTLPELLAKLEHSPSLFDKLVAARLKIKLELPRWREELREQLKLSDDPFHPLAYELLNT